MANEVNKGPKKSLFSIHDNSLMRLRQIIHELSELQHDLMFLRNGEGRSIAESLLEAKKHTESCLRALKVISDYGT